MLKRQSVQCAWLPHPIPSEYSAGKWEGEEKQYINKYLLIMVQGHGIQNSPSFRGCSSSI